MRKQRTREHIIEDLSFNHVERQILHAGYIMRRNSQNDYGYDGLIHTFNSRGEAENFFMSFQLKSTDHINLSQQKEAFTFDLSKQDLELWLRSKNPVLLILYDAQKDIAYFIDLQPYFQENRILLKNVRKFVRVYIPETAVFNSNILKQLRQLLK
jgi:Domain of unknown function (DUF4365)